MRTKSNRTYFVIVALWLAFIAGGLAALTKHQFVPGIAAAAVPTDWPAKTDLQRPADKYFLLLFVHPQCPCTDATIDEMNEILARTNGKLSASVVFVLPNSPIPGAEKGSLWTAVANIPGVRAIKDTGAVEALRFDAHTSGQTFLYSSTGQLLFNGGITDGRGHAGDNDGVDAIIDFVIKGHSNLAHTPVYGCELFDPLKDHVGGV